MQHFSANFGLKILCYQKQECISTGSVWWKLWKLTKTIVADDKMGLWIRLWN